MRLHTRSLPFAEDRDPSPISLWTRIHYSLHMVRGEHRMMIRTHVTLVQWWSPVRIGDIPLLLLPSTTLQVLQVLIVYIVDHDHVKIIGGQITNSL